MAKIRNDPLSHGFLNSLAANIETLDTALLLEHRNTGIHNALEIPLALGHIEYPTAYLFDGSFYSSVSNPATGQYSLTLPAATYNSVAMVGMLNISDEAVQNKPHCMSVEMVSATSCVARFSELTTALGVAGNAWAAADRKFDIGVHTTPKPREATLTTPRNVWRRGDYLKDLPPQFDGLATNYEVVKKTLVAEHTITGIHNINRIAKETMWITYDTGPGDYYVTHTSSGNTASKISTGICEITLKGSYSDMALFPQTSTLNADELVVCHARQVADDLARVYSYGCNLSTGIWSRVDRDFFISCFGEPL